MFIRRHFRSIVRATLLIGAVVAITLSSHNLPAGFVVEPNGVTVEIDDFNYGSFEKIEGLSKINGEIDSEGNRYTKVTLHRNFVTDPSLYLWAKNTAKRNEELRDIHLVKRNKLGQEISRYVLKLCQPLSWTVESANSALGGFHETVDVAVHKIEVY